MKLLKYSKNPILTPNPQNPWEALVTCNPGAWCDNGTVYLLYRAAGNDEEHRIHLGLAVSRDGFNFTRVSDKPVLSPSADGFDGGCVEDARIVKMGDTFYVTYACRSFPAGKYWIKNFHRAPYKNCPDFPRSARENLTLSGLLISKDLRSFYRAGSMTSPDDDDRDVILFPEKVGGKFVMLHRPADWHGPAYGCAKPSIWISKHHSMLGWKEHHLLAQPRVEWEHQKIGGAAPPVKTDKGWLLLYHGVDKDTVYRTGIMMLDLENPARVIARAPDCILEPEHDYEMKGIMPRVVFPTGNVVLGDKLFVYYGGADQVVGAATAPLKDLVDYVLQYPE